ncbi:anhydro-N-acetylmuramic acid kinase [Maribellus sp. CM-23]|uniref:anhydro-N-acetylmuramic acid kinase n=1 Tax=Maribellus sp. CM-23 TaxID=2781026 RepID=UPI001F317E53|nr:anhydro-N-acetylmuramic acid kinase [Maribellus sp. CM-23]MCE4565845.1 anhydro-N-acetylmuramic acid kinase [Maribellus sp. CM-23]
MEQYIGIMSGTSMDGIDTVLVGFEDNKILRVQMHSQSFPEKLKSVLTELINSYRSEIYVLGEVDHQLALCYADAVKQLLQKSSTDSSDVVAIGCHGQTVFHSPATQFPFTMQLGDGNVIAAQTGIRTVVDFRRMDMAFGGQGAPLVPAFHQAFLYSKREKRVVLNLGGIANITVLADNDDSVLGFDTGPANCLMDAWILHCLDRKFDKDGEWAASGKVIPKLLSEMLADDYFKQPAPKSTGRELFNLDWLNKHLQGISEYRKEDVQATLLELTAASVAQSVEKYAPETDAMYVCGGGAFNKILMKRLAFHLPGARVANTEELGIHPQQMEAVAFAWLAMRRIKDEPGNLPSVTGAHKKVLLGTIYDPKTF